MQDKPHHRALASLRAQWSAINPRTRLVLAIAGGIAAVLSLALIAVNLLISADWVRERIAQRVKQETGRELRVNGATVLLFTPGPRIVVTDAAFVDPEARAGSADFSVERLSVDLSFAELLSRQIDARKLVLRRPVVTVRLGPDGTMGRRSEAGDKPQPLRFAKADTAGGEAAGGEDASRREIRLSDVRIQDGTVNIVYDDKGTVRRIEHINAKLSLPSVSDPLTGRGTFDWKQQTVEWSLALASPADLREARPARLEVGLDTDSVALRFDGSVRGGANFSGEGQLSAKVHSIPSLLAWMRETPPASSAIGDGELASHVSWKAGEIEFSDARFALEHATGQGQAVVTLRSPRPHVRAALAFDLLNLNPFLARGAGRAAQSAAAQRAVPQQETPPVPSAAPEASAPVLAVSPPEPDGAVSAQTGSPGPAEPPALATRVARPAAFDADVNLNVRKTRFGHLDIGPSSIGFALRDGVLNAMLGGMELYDGQGSGRLVVDTNKPVPTFSGNFQLDGVQVRPLLSDATQFNLLSGRTKLDLELSGAGSTSEEIRPSLQGTGNVAISDGAIEGINLTELIASVGAGQMPNLRQGPGAKTAFSDLGGSFTITNGVAETNNLQMVSPLLKVAAAGTVDLINDSINILATPQIVAEESGGGRKSNALAGLSIPVRVEGSLQNPSIRPELKGLFGNSEQAGETVRQIGDAIKKSFKGKPAGEALGRFLGNVQIRRRGGGESEDGASAPKRGQTAPSFAPAERPDPQVEDILR